MYLSIKKKAANSCAQKLYLHTIIVEGGVFEKWCFAHVQIVSGDFFLRKTLMGVKSFWEDAKTLRPSIKYVRSNLGIFKHPLPL